MVCPWILSTETILFWIWPYVLWLVTVHKRTETILEGNLFKGRNYSRKYGTYIVTCTIMSLSKFRWIHRKLKMIQFDVFCIWLFFFRSNMMCWSITQANQTASKGWAPILPTTIAEASRKNWFIVHSLMGKSKVMLKSVLRNYFQRFFFIIFITNVGQTIATASTSE